MCIRGAVVMFEGSLVCAACGEHIGTGGSAAADTDELQNDNDRENLGPRDCDVVHSPPAVVNPAGSADEESEDSNDETDVSGENEEGSVVDSAPAEEDDGAILQDLEQYDRTLGLDARAEGLDNAAIIHDVDCIGLYTERADAIRSTQPVQLESSASKGFVNRRTKLYGEGRVVGKDMEALHVGQLGHSRIPILFVWKSRDSVEDEGIPNSMSCEEGKIVYKEAVKKAVGNILADEELEQRHGASTNLAFVANRSTICSAGQWFSGEFGGRVLGEVWKSFREEVRRSFPYVSVGVFLELFGQKAPLVEYAKDLDRWFDLSKCKWVHIAVGSVVRQGTVDQRSTFLTRTVRALWRRGSGSVQAFTVAGHPLLCGVSWKKKDADDRFALEDDVFHASPEGLNLSTGSLEKMIMYSEKSHVAWGLDSRRLPFQGHRMAAVMALPATSAGVMLGKRGGDVAVFIGNHKATRDYFMERFDDLRKGRCGMRMEGDYVVKGASEDVLSFVQWAERISQAHERLWAVVASHRGVVSYPSDSFWRRPEELFDSWFDALERLEIMRQANGPTGLSVGQVVMVAIIECLLDLLLNGNETSTMRQLLEASGMQELFDHASRPFIPSAMVDEQLEYILPNKEFMAEKLRSSIPYSLDGLVRRKTRGRGKELLCWKAEIDRLFGRVAVSALSMTDMLNGFFLERGLPVLSEDLARKFNHSCGKGMKKAFAGRDVYEMLKCVSTEGVADYRRRHGLTGPDEEHDCKFVVEEASASAKQVAFALITGSCASAAMMPKYFMFPALVTATECKRQQYSQRNPHAVGACLTDYLESALKGAGWNIFPKFSSTRSFLCARRFVQLMRSHDAAAAIDSGPCAKRRRIQRLSTPTNLDLKEWIVSCVNSKRTRHCTDRELEDIGTLCRCVFDESVAMKAASDLERKALVLCALKHVIEFGDGEWKKVYKLYYQQWKFSEKTLHPFWLQPFYVGEEPRTLFVLVNTAQGQLVKTEQWRQSVL